MERLLAILPGPLRENLKRADDAYAARADICHDDNEDLFEECDDVFYEHEGLLMDVLKVYANSLSL